MSIHMNVDKWVPALKPFWDRGMNSWKKTELISEAANFTGLSTEDVKHWMSNYRKRIQRQEKREKTEKQGQTLKGQKRKWSGYDIYKKECIASGKAKATSEMNKAWKNLSTESRQMYNKKAQGRAGPSSTCEAEIMKAMNIIRKQINVLNGSQCKGTVFMCIPPGRSGIECVGDKDAQRMIQECGDFRKIYVKTFTGETPLSKQPSKKIAIKDCVHNGFTCKYEMATGNSCMCPYRKFTEGVYQAITNGNPESITAEYLVSQMEEALASDDEEDDEDEEEDTDYVELEKKPPIAAMLSAANTTMQHEQSAILTVQPPNTVLSQSLAIQQPVTITQTQPTMASGHITHLTTLTPVTQLNQSQQTTLTPQQITISQDSVNHQPTLLQPINQTITQHIPIAHHITPMTQTIPLTPVNISSISQPPPIPQAVPISQQHTQITHVITHPAINQQQHAHQVVDIGTLVQQS